jgi:hypothetical protein
MKLDDFESVKVEELSKDIEALKKMKNGLKVELLQLYLVNFILYSNLDDENKNESPIKDTLLEIVILIEKLVSLESKMDIIDVKRVLDDRMMKKKSTHNNSKTVTPAKKFKINSEKQRERTKPKEDYNIKAKSKPKK